MSAATDEISLTDVKALRKALMEHEAFDKFEHILTDEYILLLLGLRGRDGKLREFHYHYKKLDTVLNTLATFHIGDFLRSVPEEILSKPLLYQAGRDNNGKSVLVMNFNRWDPHTPEPLLKDMRLLALLTFLAVVENNEAAQVTTVLIANHFKTSSILALKEFRFLRELIPASEAAFPDRGYKQFNFVPSSMQTLASMVVKLLPKSLQEKQILGSFEFVIEKLRETCSNAEDIVPEDVGGNGEMIEQNIEWTVKADGSIVSRILPVDESGGKNRVVFEDETLAKKTPVAPIEKEI